MLYVSCFKLVLYLVNRQFRAFGEVYRPRKRAAAVVRARMSPRALRLRHPAGPAPTKASKPSSAPANQGSGPRSARCVQMKH